MMNSFVIEFQILALQRELLRNCSVSPDRGNGSFEGWFMQRVFMFLCVAIQLFCLSERDDAV